MIVGECPSPTTMALRMANVLVTGGAGFIGSNLVRALLERGDEVRVLDNFSTGYRANLDGLDIEMVEGELRSYERVHNAVRGTEVVYHLGALGSVPRSVQDPLTSNAVNVEGTLNVLLAARDEGVRRVIFSSSSSVYGSRRRSRCAEELAARPDLALRGCEARGGALLRRFTRIYERSRASCSATSTSSGRARTRSRSTRPSIPLFIEAIARGEPVDDLRRRRAVARLHVRRERRRREHSAPRRAGASGADLQHRGGVARDRQRARRHDRRGSSARR